jgi:hypothetical protein
MSQFRELVANFSISAILIMSLFSFFIIFEEENNAPEPLKDNEIFNESFSSLITSIETSTEEAEEKYDVFNSEEPQAGFGSIVLFGIVSVGKTFSGIIFGFFVSIIKLPLIMLGIPASIYNLVLTLLIITTIVSVWLLYKLGG